MLRSTFLSSARPVYAASLVEGGDAATAKASRQRQASAKPDKDTDETGARAIYLKPEKTAADIMVRLESFAEAGIRFLSSVVVHMVVRTYSTVEADRVKDNKTLMAEIEGIIQEFAKGKRGGKAFEHAWLSRIMSTARTMGVKLITDGKGLMSGPVGDILRSKTVETANEIVFQRCLQVTKGSTSFTALTKMLSPANAKPGKGGKEPAKGSNAVKPVAGTNAAVAKRLLSDKGFEVLNAIPGKPVAKAVKMADKVSQSNVDQKAFLFRMIEQCTETTVLLEAAELCKARAKALSKSAKGQDNDGEAKPAEKAQAVA
jgi:hypothetical protein